MVWHHGLLYKLKRNSINGDFIKLIESFSSDRYHKFVLNGQTCKWNKNTTRVPQGSILYPVFFLFHISDPSSELCCSSKLFTDHTSLFSVVKNVNETAKSLNKDLENISKWVHQWKMSFSLDPTKMAKEVLLSRKNLKVINSNLIFIGKVFHSSPFQKCLDLV